MNVKTCLCAAVVVGCSAVAAQASPAITAALKPSVSGAEEVACRGYHCRGYYRRAHGYRHNGYYEHDLSTLRFGGRRWWSVYDEQHGGRR
jgi:hypothetical protein